MIFSLVPSEVMTLLLSYRCKRRPFLYHVMVAIGTDICGSHINSVAAFRMTLTFRGSSDSNVGGTERFFRKIKQEIKYKDRQVELISLNFSMS